MPILTATDYAGYDEVAKTEMATVSGVVAVLNNNSNTYRIVRAYRGYDAEELAIYVIIADYKYGEFDVLDAYRKAITKMVEVVFSEADADDSPTV